MPLASCDGPLSNRKTFECLDLNQMRIVGTLKMKVTKEVHEIFTVSHDDGGTLRGGGVFGG